MDTETPLSARISRRALVAAGAGCVLGAGELTLPGSMDEVEARDSGLGGRHGQDHRGRDKHHDKHERRQRHHRTEKKRGIKDVEATFINDTFALMYYSYGDGTYYELGRDQRVTLTQPQSSLSVILKIYNPYYVFNAVNPTIGLPYVKIEDANTVVFDERLEEGEQVDSPIFLVKRLTDTADSKVFEVTVHD